ncbi:FtsX-like permease family protein [Kocuria sp. HSID16901]|uniref:FtsX-like permease family protein n=1 Tax=Kocuria sp. HSID16901 TaxID=2419505 RepID=UPI0006617AD7|nr:ABC transporter permease [Kocuria sp. HSID16901]RUQ23248.1 ABC transporter permease [Kocuria sp. HSID16901]
MKDALRELTRHPQQHISTFLVVIVGAMFGSGLIGSVGLLRKILDPTGEAGGTLLVMLLMTTMTFFAIALFVSSIVVANTFSIVVAGRTHQLALMRLIGAKASALRRGIAAEGLLIGALGSAVGLVLGGIVTWLLALWAEAKNAGTDLESTAFNPWCLAPALLVVLTSWVAAWNGARPVLSVSPLEGTRRSVEPSGRELRRRKPMLGMSIALVVLGAFFLGAGIVSASESPISILSAVFGGLLSFAGIALGSAWVMPPFFGLSGLLVGHGTSGRMAVGNARRYPLRSARISMSLVIGITLVVMFGTVGSTVKSVMGSMADSGVYDEGEVMLMSQMIDNVLLFVYGMVAFAVIIAVIGVANNMRAAIMQRRVELGMLRTVGLSIGQMWRMILGETSQLTISAACLGIPLGVFYGWVGTYCMFGSVDGVQFFGPTPPWGVLIAVVAGCALITGVATAIPARKRAQESPVRALAAV